MRRIALQLAVALDAPDDRGVEPEAGVEQEPAAVDPSEPDPGERRRWSSDGEQHVGRARSGRAECRACGRRRWSSRRAAARARSSVPARPSAASLSVPSPASTATTSKPSFARGAGEAGRVSATRRLGDLDLVAASASSFADQDARAGVDRRGGGVDEQEDPHRASQGTRNIARCPFPSATDLRALGHRDRRLSGLSAPRRLARGGRAREARRLPGRGVLGPAGARLRRPDAPGPDRRARARGPRRQPHRPGLHRRPVRRLPVRVAPPHRLREPADVGTARRRPALHDMYVAAAVRCAPPANKPTPAERDECRPYPRARARVARSDCA